MRFLDLNLVMLMLANLALLGSSRLSACIQLSAAQGILLAVLPLTLPPGHGLRAEVYFLEFAILVLKGFVYPALLSRTLRTAHVRHEVVPIIGYVSSLVLGVLILCLSFWISSRLRLPHEAPSPLVLPLALSTILIGIFLIISRKTALMQVVGYLVLENGIYIFGIALAHQERFLVEMGILLDVFVAVFVMGIAIFHINREFDHIDVDQLTSLKD
jgi:hydrogenase-4 component E